MRTSGWWAAARTPRMLGILAVLLVAALACARLGAWQLDRAAQRGEQAAERAAAQAATHAPRPIDDVLVPGTPLTQDGAGVQVAVRGTYLAGTQQYLVPEEAADGAAGWLVLAPLVVADGAGAGAILPVARGWVAATGGAAVDAVAAGDEVAGGVTAELAGGGALGVPAGQVDLVGYLASSEAALAAPPAGSSADVLGSVSSGQLANLWGAPIYSGYLRLVSADPPEVPALTPAAPAEPPAAGLDLRNLAYAAQWWIFGAFAVALWVRLVRDEAARAG